MAKQYINFKTKGMNKDSSVSAFDPLFAFENMNLRLSSNESNTMLSWVNEKGTSVATILVDTAPWCTGEDRLYKVGDIVDGEPLSAYSELVGTDKYIDTIIYGTPIGTAVINHKLVIFTTDSSLNPLQDYIYVFATPMSELITLEVTVLATIELVGKLLFKGTLNFSTLNPLETLVSYESSDVQKVYWLDGINQPRFINVAKPILSSDMYKDWSFDFIPKLLLEEEVTIEKIKESNGKFPAGVILYAFTYYNMNGQESNIFYTSLLYNIAPNGRGGAPDEVVSNAFKITVENPDLNYDYLRIYSIVRTSINNTPIVKRVLDIELNKTAALSTEVSMILTLDKPIVKDPSIKLLEFFDSNGSLIGEEVTASLLPNTSSMVWIKYNAVELPYLNIETTEGYIKGREDTTNGIFIYVLKTPVFLSAYDTDEDLNPKYYIVSTTASGTPINLRKYTESPIGKVSYIDTGYAGGTIDPSELLYKTREVSAFSTFELKDGTLFLGDIKYNRNDLRDLEESIKGSPVETARYLCNIDAFPTNSIYPYLNHLQYDVPAGFKHGDYYRLGVQFQHENGKWSTPIWINDVQQDKLPSKGITLSGYLRYLRPIFKSLIPTSVISELINRKYKKVRPVVVLPELLDRVTLCQGVVCPTVYTTNHRTTNKDLYALSSWFFRLYGGESGNTSIGSDIDLNTYTVKPYSSNSGPLYYQDSNLSAAEIQSLEILGNFKEEDKFKIDKTCLSFYSPEIEFDDSIRAIKLDSSLLWYLVGKSTIINTLSDIDIQTETATIARNVGGFTKKSFNHLGAYGIVSGLFYEDFIVDEHGDKFEAYDQEKSAVRWLIYPWHRSGALNNDILRPADKGIMTAKLKKKVISNLRIFNSPVFGNLQDGVNSSQEHLHISTIAGWDSVYTGSEGEILRCEEKVYRGNIDTILVPSKGSELYFGFTSTGSIRWGLGPGTNARYTKAQPPISPDSSSITTNYEQEVKWRLGFYEDYNGTNNLIRTYKDKGIWYYFGDVEDSDNNTSYHMGWNRPYLDFYTNIGDAYDELVVNNSFVRMKYKSTPHLVLETIPSVSEGITANIDWTTSANATNEIIPIFELRREDTEEFRSTLFGGTSSDAFKENTWIPCGEPISLKLNSKTVKIYNGNTYFVVPYTHGDTYYQRWDCLKTYPFTPEDENQIVEIGSFILETRINIDGRYDRNRGLLSNLHVSPLNFNLLNPVYSQRNNFFSYKILDDGLYAQTAFPNLVTWTLTKESGADVDLWTNVTLASILELDGDKGKLTSLLKLNNNLIAFLDTGISLIMYNENVQISTESGIPIELANSGKVSGKTYISDTIGCSNKWSIANTPMGIYFIDNHDKSIYLFNGLLEGISLKGGFDSWCKLNISVKKDSWNPVDFNDFVTYYDRANLDLLFINKTIALAYSEKFGTFTSFYEYGSAPYLCNLDNNSYWLNKNITFGSSSSYYIWKHQGSNNYCNFFGKPYPYWTILVGNQYPYLDKTFTNLEFRACVTNDGTTLEDSKLFGFYLPFDNLEIWDEYQWGKSKLQRKDSKGITLHHLNDAQSTSALTRKFRIWRCDLPRDNYPIPQVPEELDEETPEYTAAREAAQLVYDAYREKEAALGIHRVKSRPLDRIRNPWVYVKLEKELYPTLPKVEVHDVMMTYYN